MRLKKELCFSVSRSLSRKLPVSQHAAALCRMADDVHRKMFANVTSASGPARSRRASPGVQRQRNASRHEA
jgi:hypothetical protein